ncbi:MAG: toxin-antitoxin system YwqK family antitoxin [Bdellovibrionales bacterium]|nr:toxin-antitoxin system YwqK family antitoxin [Bdellovibrionales bacterium]
MKSLPLVLALTLALAAANPAFAKDELDCPSDTKLVEGIDEKSGGKSLWCERETGSKTGPFRIYYPNKQIMEEGVYKNDNKHGPMKAWHSNGNLKSEGEYVNDRIEGFWTRFHETGEKMDAGEWANGFPDGMWKLFHKNGQLKAEGRFKKGDRLGIWRNYDERGKLIKEERLTDLYREWRQGFKPLSFSLHGLLAYQNGDEYSYTGQLFWNPTLFLGETFYLRGAIGATMLKGETWIEDRESFVALENTVLVGFYYSNLPALAVELGGGLQTWTGIRSDLMGSANLIWERQEPIAGLIRRFSLGYGLVLGELQPTHLFRIGLGIDLM